MNLISCENCGVVLNLNCIKRPPIMDNKGVINPDAVVCDGKFLNTFPCPVCNERILIENGAILW